jgi:hypothetical protein
VILTSGIVRPYLGCPPERRRPWSLRCAEAERQADEPLHLVQIRSPNPSLQNGALHLRQLRSRGDIRSGPGNPGL